MKPTDKEKRREPEGTAEHLRRLMSVALATFESTSNVYNFEITMSPKLATTVSQLVNLLGSPEFPGMTPEGGTLFGYRVLASDETESDVILIRAFSRETFRFVFPPVHQRIGSRTND